MKRWLGVKPTGPVETECAPVDVLGPVTMRFRPVLPTDEQAMAMIALQLVNAPKQLLSRYSALKDYMQKDDPDAEIDRITVEQAMADPQVASEWISDALRRAGFNPKPPQLVGPDGRPISSGAPGGMGGGEPTVPGLNEPLAGQQALAQKPHPGQASMAEHLHGAGGLDRAARAGSYPGRPAQ